MDILRGEGTGEVANYPRQEDLKLRHREVLAEAHPRPHPEWHVQVGELAGAGDPVGEPLRVELV